MTKTYRWLGPDEIDPDFPVMSGAMTGFFAYKYQAPTPQNLQTFAEGRCYYSKIEQLDDPEEGRIQRLGDDDPQPHFWDANVGQIARQFGLGIQVGKVVDDGNKHHALDLAKRRWKEVKEWIYSCGVYCVSEIPNSREMWEKYADRHSGFCIGFVINDFSESRTIPIPAPIVYEPNGVQDVHFPNLCARYADVEDRAISVLLTKQLEWKYQRERRVFSRQSGTYPFPWPLNHVIFGRACTQTTRSAVVSAVDRMADGKLDCYEEQPTADGRIRIVKLGSVT